MFSRMAILRLLMILAIMSAAFSESAWAQSTPSAKPDRLHVSKYVSTRDAETLYRALRAADEYRWDDVARLKRSAQSDRVKDVIVWRQVTGDAPGIGFDEVLRILDRLEGWPMRSTMQVRAEELIENSALSAAERVNWFEENSPLSGAGLLFYAKALQSEGQTEAAIEQARKAWRGRTMDRAITDQLRANFGSSLTQDDHRARVDFLLWTNQRSEAQRLKFLLTDDWKRLVDARVALAAGLRGVDTRIAAVPSHLQANPGLLYERARWRRRRGNQDGATSLLVGIDGSEAPEVARSNLWTERNIAFRRSLQDGLYSQAYQLTAPHGMHRGVDFAEAEWAAGWIALRFRDDAARAEQHFETLGANVSSPISKARAGYWTGRASSAQGNAADADAAFEAASQFPFTFYGQLAAEEAGSEPIYLEQAIPPTEEQRQLFEEKPVVEALRLLGETGFDQLFRRFAYHIDDTVQTPQEIALLSEIAELYQYPEVGVRAAKQGLAGNIVEPDAAYPLVDYPLLREPGVERPLMLALARQESEMNPSAISHADARGLMQFIPSTARHQARISGLPYRTSWLTDDPAYNMTLGGAYLDDLLARFNGSYVMTAAAYNAGPTRVRTWISRYGDPRAGDVDFLDWIELIPFSETRNYVQRVIENTQVYRHRLTGEPAPIQTKEDVERGSFR